MRRDGVPPSLELIAERRRQHEDTLHDEHARSFQFLLRPREPGCCVSSDVSAG